MTWLDRVIQRWRIAKALAHVPPQALVCDIGTFDGALFRAGASRRVRGVGIDPLVLRENSPREGVTLRPGFFPAALRGEGPFQVITALAVVEHIPESMLETMLQDIAKHLAADGRLVVTMPSPMADHVLDALLALRLIKGQSLEQHYGLSPERFLALCTSAGFEVVVRERFQLGLNNLFVLRLSQA